MTLEAFQTQTTNEHPTPVGILEDVRKVFGGQIDLDPASSYDMNQFVRAKRYYTKEQDGLIGDWTAENVFLNPPGSQASATSLGPRRGPSALEWLDKLVESYEDFIFEQAIYVGYNGPETLSKRPQHCRKADAIIHSSIEHTCTDPKYGMTKNGRIKFLGDRPFFPSLILYFGMFPGTFLEHFRKYGTVIEIL